MPRSMRMASACFQADCGVMSQSAPPMAPQSRRASSSRASFFDSHTARCRPWARLSAMTPAISRPLPQPVPSPRKKPLRNWTAPGWSSLTRITWCGRFAEDPRPRQDLRVRLAGVDHRLHLGVRDQAPRRRSGPAGPADRSAPAARPRPSGPDSTSGEGCGAACGEADAAQRIGLVEADVVALARPGAGLIGDGRGRRQEGQPVGGRRQRPGPGRQDRAAWLRPCGTGAAGPSAARPTPRPPGPRRPGSPPPGLAGISPQGAPRSITSRPVSTEVPCLA